MDGDNMLRPIAESSFFGGTGNVAREYETIDDCLIASTIDENDQLSDTDQANKELLPKPYVSTKNNQRPGHHNGKNKSKGRSPPPLPPRQQSMSPPVLKAMTDGRRVNKQKPSPPGSATPPSVYSASTCATSATFMAPNVIAMHNSGSYLMSAENSSNGSGSNPATSGSRVGTNSQTASGRSASRSPPVDGSSAHSSLPDSGGYLMRTNSGSLFIASPQDAAVSMIADSPETMRTSVGGGVVVEGTPHHHGFGTSMSHDSAVATTNTTGGGTLSSRSKKRRSGGSATLNGSKYKEKMFESVPIRLANIQMNYDPSTGVTRPLLYHTDFRSYSALLSKVTRRCSSSWRCLSISLIVLLLLILLTICFLFLLHNLYPEYGFLTSIISTSVCQVLPLFTNVTSLPRSRTAAPAINIDLKSPSSSGGIQFYMPERDFVAFDIVRGVSPYGLVGVYGRRFTPPTRFRFDFFKLIDHSILKSQFSSDQSVFYRLDNSTLGFAELLDEGQWYILFTNDDDYRNSKPSSGEKNVDSSKVDRIGVSLFLHGSFTTGCQNDCNGHGYCETATNGKTTCHCTSGFTGYDCSMPVCPVTCSGRGRLVAGPKCLCDLGWKGSECNVPESSCEDPSCSGHGLCINGVCQCHAGYQGDNCQEALCLDNCSARGVCVDGTCYCKPNYVGPSCSTHVSNADSSFGQGTDSPLIHPGDEAILAAELCRKRCVHGRCGGDNNDICSCSPGFNGHFCSFDGCPNNCTGNGRCIKAAFTGRTAHYTCRCNHGWKDEDCSTPREKCSGGVDEDGDSLVDCADPDCCTKALCSKSPACATVPNPLLQLLSLPVLPANSPFAERVSFLLGDVQLGAQVSPTETMNILDQKRMSVVAGSVVLAKDNSHLVGVKVYQVVVGTAGSIVDLGYTLSREQGGSFDLLVEGGGVVWIRFEHYSSTLCPKMVAVNVGWNEFEVLEAPVAIEAAQDGSCDIAAVKDCSAKVTHDHSKLSPSVFTTWQAALSGTVGNKMPFDSTVIPELSDPVEILPIGNTGYSLNWLGNFAKKRLANIFIRMTPENPALLPDELVLVKLQVTVEGVLEDRLFEAQPDLTHLYSWSGKNRFNSESAGVVLATVRVGYVYQNCSSSPVWITRRISLLSPTSAQVTPPFAGWFLSGHHFYDTQNAILYRSDGSVRLFGESLYLRRIIGQPGRRRLLTSCSSCATNPECRCEGFIDDIRLSRPRDIALNRAGNLVVLDDNAILEILIHEPQAESKIVFDFQAESGISHIELMELVSVAVHPTEDALYVADRRGRRIFKVGMSTSQSSFEIVAGSSSGQICSAPQQQDLCGDDMLATSGLLIQPKSLTFDKFGNLFVADGHVIRMIRNNSKIIETYVGRLDYERDEQQPLRCWQKPVNRNRGNELIDWPTIIAVSPVDDSLYVVDANNVIYQVTTDEQVIVVAGRAPNCPLHSGKPQMAPENVRFRSIKDIYIAFNGDLYILQANPAEVLVLPADRIQVRKVTGQRCYASTKSLPTNCVPAFNRTSMIPSSWFVSAADLTFNDPTSIVAFPSGTVFVADSRDNAIYALEHSKPVSSGGNDNAVGWRYYDVYDAELDQIHRFDLMGNHKMTVAASTGATLTTFTYHTEGKLQAPLNKVINPGTGFELTFTRTFADNSFLPVITSNTGGQQFSARVVDASSPMDAFVDSDNRTTFFTYTTSLLLRSIHRPDGRWTVYDYDGNTRLVRASTSGVTTLITVDPKLNRNAGIMTTVISASSAGKAVDYKVVGNDLAIMTSEPLHQTRMFFRIAPSVWMLTAQDSSGASSQLSVIDSRSLGANGLDGRKWASINGNTSIEWRRTSPPAVSSSSAVALANVGQVLRQLRVTDSLAVSVLTSLVHGSMMNPRGASRSSIDVFGMPRLMSFDERESLVSSVSANIALIAHLNRTSQPPRETFFNLQTPLSNSTLQQQAAVQLLFVSYDNADRPIQLKPAHHKFPAVRLDYVSNCQQGLLSSVRFGDVASSWHSDQRGFLKLRTFSDGRAFEFEYLGNTSLLESITLVGSKKLLSFKYDPDTRGLEAIVDSESNVKYRFRGIQGLGFSRRIVTLPGFFPSARTDLEVALDRGIGFTRVFPVGKSQSTAVANFSVAESGGLTWVNFSDGDIEKFTSGLTIDHAVATYSETNCKISLDNSKSSNLLSGAQFYVGSSNVLTLLRNSTSLTLDLPTAGSKSLSSNVVNSGPISLKVAEFGKIEKVLVGNWTILNELDSHSRIVHVTVYEPNSRKPLAQSTAFYEILHHEEMPSSNKSPWRVARKLWHLLNTNELYGHIYEWTPSTENSRLKSVKVERSLNSGKPTSFGTSTAFTWSSLNGNLLEVTSAKSEATETQMLTKVTFSSGRQDQLLSYTTASGTPSSISYHSEGCISRIAQRSFTYNSLGQLVVARQGGSEVKLAYDAFGRLSYISGDGQKLALLYDNQKSGRLLVTADVSSGKVQRYHYSPISNCLMGIQEDLDGYMTAILTDPWCSPAVGIKPDGSHIFFPNLYGLDSFAGPQTSQSQGDAGLLLGFHGFIHLRKFSLVFVDQTRPMDTFSGRFLCPDFASLLADGRSRGTSPGLNMGNTLVSNNEHARLLNLFQFVGPDATRTNFHLLSLDNPVADNFAGDTRAWLANVLAPVSVSQLNKETLMSEKSHASTELFVSGQILSTLVGHHAKTFGVATRAEMAVDFRLASLSGFSASSNSYGERWQDWPIFIPPPTASPIFAHPALSHTSLSAAHAFGNGHYHVFELIVSGKVTSPVLQYKALLKLVTVALNGTLFLSNQAPDRDAVDFFQYNLFKANRSVTLQSDLNQMSPDGQISCTKRFSFGSSFDVVADCSSNVFKVRSSPNHLFTIKYGEDVKTRLGRL